MESKRYFIIHGTTSCPFCINAISLMEEKNISYIFSTLTSQRLIESTKERYEHKTVPMVVERDLYDLAHEHFVGGYTELRNYLNLNSDEKGGSCDLDGNCD